MKLILIAAVALLTGCVAMGPAVEIGPNRYQARAQWGGSAGPEHEAKSMATKKCASLGKSLGEMSIATSPDESNEIAIITFECQ